MKVHQRFNLITETVDEMQIGMDSVAHSYSQFGHLLNRATDIRKISIFSNFERPRYATFTPFPYQWDAVDLMLNKFEGRGVFADQVGLGKTVQALLTAHIMFLAGEINNCVVVASSNLLPQWRREVATKFTGIFNFIDNEGQADMNFSSFKKSLTHSDAPGIFDKPTILFLSLESLKRNVERENEFRTQIEIAEKDIQKCNEDILREMEKGSKKSEEQKDYDILANYMNTETKSMRISNEHTKVIIDKKIALEKKIESIKASSILYQKIDLLIVDEAHAPAKNKEQSLLLQKLNKAYCILISATPIRENIDDIYNLIKIVDSNRFPTIEKFYSFCGAKSISELIAEDGSFEKVSKLNGLINSLFTRKRLYDPIVVKSFELKSAEIVAFLVALSNPTDKAAALLSGFERFKGLSLEELKEKIESVKRFIDISAGIIMRKAEMANRPDLLKMFLASNTEKNEDINEITLKYISRGLMEYYKDTQDILVLDYLDWTRPTKVGECYLVADKAEAYKQIRTLFSADNRDNKTKVLVFAKAVAEREDIRNIFEKIDPERKLFIDGIEKKNKDIKTQNMQEFKTFAEENYDAIYLIDKTRKEGADFNIASRLVLFQMESPNSFNLIEPLEMEQLIGRISRVGQKEKCKIYVFAYSEQERELFNLYNDPEGLDLFGKCSTEIDFVVPIIVEYFNKKYRKEEAFVNLKKSTKTRSFVELFAYAYSKGQEEIISFKEDIHKICRQFLTDLVVTEVPENEE